MSHRKTATTDRLPIPTTAQAAAIAGRLIAADPGLAAAAAGDRRTARATADTVRLTGEEVDAMTAGALVDELVDVLHVALADLAILGQMDPGYRPRCLSRARAALAKIAGR